MTDKEIADDLTICLTGSAAWSSRRHVLRLPASSTLQDLQAQCQQEFGPCQLKHGFPPQLIGDCCTATLVQSGIRNQDRILVLPAENTASMTTTSPSPKTDSKDPSANSKATNENTSSAGALRRNKRAAASAAEASFAETIRQQDKILQAEHTKPSPSKRSRGAPSARSPNASSSKPRFQAASTTGYRLQDGAAITPRRKPRSARGPTPDLRGLSSEDASAMALLTAAEGGVGAQSSVSRLMRRNWRQAVNDAYEQNQAVARLAAIASGTARFETSGVASAVASGDASAATHPASLTVTYPKGVQGRGNFTDSVDFLPLEVLQSVIAAIHPANPEALRGENLSLLSPRVLWSLIYHTQGSISASAPSSVESALKQVRPNLDWGFLRRRREQLSAKALENLRQQQERSSEHGSESNWEAAAQAIESVEQAMADLQTLDRRQRASQLATAASQRMSWHVITPTETDEDELRECISETVPANDLAPLIRLLLKCGIRNWRDLANADEHAIASKVSFPVSTVNSWIDKAQDESLEEIMVEVCGGNVSGVELLREIQSGTPKDLASWRTIVPFLHQTLSERHPDTTIPSQTELQSWCDRAQRALEQLEWLEFYSTPL